MKPPIPKQLVPHWRTTKPPECIAIIEMSGTGLKFEVRPRNDLKRSVATDKKRIFLGNHLAENDNVFSDDIMDEVIEGLTAIRGQIDVLRKQGHEITVFPVASSPLRIAENAAIFKDRAFKEAHYIFQELTGEQEAILGGKAALQHDTNANGVMVDIGGGSTEFARLMDGEIISVTSVNFGTGNIHSLEDARAMVHALSPEFFDAPTVFPISGTSRLACSFVDDEQGRPASKEYFMQQQETLRNKLLSNDHDGLAKEIIKRSDKVINSSYLFEALLERMPDSAFVQSYDARLRDALFTECADRLNFKRNKATYQLGQVVIGLSSFLPR